MGTTLIALPAISSARDRGVNQPGAAGGVAGVGAPGVGVVDPGINQPGVAGNVGRPGVVAGTVVAAAGEVCWDELAPQAAVDATTATAVNRRAVRRR